MGKRLVYEHQRDVPLFLIFVGFPIAQPIKTKLVWETERGYQKACLNEGISCSHLYCTYYQILSKIQANLHLSYKIHFKKMVSASRTLIALIQLVNSRILSWTILVLHEDSLKPEKNPLSILNYKRKLSLTSFWLRLIYQGIAKMGLHCVGGIWKSKTKFLRLILPSILIRHVNGDPGSHRFRRCWVIHSELQMLLLELKLKTSNNVTKCLGVEVNNNQIVASKMSDNYRNMRIMLALLLGTSYTSLLKLCQKLC